MYKGPIQEKGKKVESGEGTPGNAKAEAKKAKGAEAAKAAGEPPRLAPEPGGEVEEVEAVPYTNLPLPTNKTGTTPRVPGHVKN